MAQVFPLDELDEPESGVPTAVSRPPRQGNIPIDVMIGIDPHKATHTVVAIDSNEMMPDEKSSD